MCNTCDVDHYRAQQDCDACDLESSVSFVMTVVFICFFIVAVLLLTKYDFKLASVTALVDFMQTIAILGHLRLPWPVRLDVRTLCSHHCFLLLMFEIITH